MSTADNEAAALTTKDQFLSLAYGTVDEGLHRDGGPAHIVSHEVFGVVEREWMQGGQLDRPTGGPTEVLTYPGETSLYWRPNFVHHRLDGPGTVISIRSEANHSSDVIMWQTHGDVIVEVLSSANDRGEAWS